jgi:hypothetical protein
LGKIKENIIAHQIGNVSGYIINRSFLVIHNIACAWWSLHKKGIAGHDMLKA